MRVLWSYLDNWLVVEYNDLLFNIKKLKINFDMKKLEMEEIIFRFQKDVEFKNELMLQYKFIDISLVIVYKK